MCEHSWCPLCGFVEWVGDLRWRYRLWRHPPRPVSMIDLRVAVGETHEVIIKNLEENLFESSSWRI
jgi:hypothetical protein